MPPSFDAFPEDILPPDVASLLRRGLAAQQAGDLDAAERCYDAAIAHEPAHPDALYLLATVRVAQQRPEAAAALLERALRAKPDFPGALRALGALQRDAGRAGEAFVLLRRALELRPGSPELQADLADALFELGRPEESVGWYRRALETDPNDVGYLVRLGRALRTAGDLDAAAVAYARAFDLAPDEPAIHNNLGNVQFARGDLTAAVASYRRAIALRSDYADAWYNLGMALLTTGDLTAGWEACLWRLRRREALRERAGAPLIPWDGAEMQGKVLLLRAEQGLGDTIQFCRYAPLAAGRARVVLAVPRSLVSLLSGLPGVERVVALGDPLPPSDAECPLLNLPHVFGTTLDTIPGPSPYLAADPARVAVWRARLAGLPGLKVGLVWAGNPRLGTTALLDRRRSMKLAQLAPLAAVPGVVFISLQKGETAAEARTPPAGMALIDWTAELADFADTAALATALDLVISVDTSVVHLAGALGRPVWLLNRGDSDWRWLLHGETTPWYPTMRIFRQTEWADWEAPVAAVAQALAAFRPAPEPAAGPQHDLVDAALAALLKAGLAAHETGGPDAALARYEEVLGRDPDQPDALYLSGMIHLARGALETGSQRLERALRARPEFPSALFNLGMAYRAQDREADAAAMFRRTIAADPAMVAAHGALGASLHRLGQVRESLESYRRAVALKPDDATFQLNLGVVLQALGHVQEAIGGYRRALELDPRNVDAHNNLGVALAELHRLDEAAASYRRALEIDPGHAQTHTNLGIALLLAGRYEAAWAEWEWRLHTEHAKGEDRGFTQPVWDGGPMAGGVLFLHAEQGLGDTLMFCRYVPLAAARSQARVVLEVQPELVRLLQDLPGIAAIQPRGAALPVFDRHASLATLPGLFGTTLATVPADVPYLHAAPDAVALWRQRLAALPGLTVGLVWAGNPGLGRIGYNPVDQRRSLSLARLAPLARVPGVVLISLQKGGAARQARPPPAGMRVLDPTDHLRDFADTAALVEALDLVITVDTSVAHVAGALGRPVWLLNRYDPDWRWLLGREDCPWYPTLRQFRQPTPGAWDEVVARVADALARMAAGRPENEPFDHGNARYRAGDLAAAAAAYRQALAINPGLLGARANLAVTLLALGRPEQAEPHLRHALRIDPGSPHLHLRLGLALNAQGHARPAVEAFERALALQPDDATTLSALGVAQAAAGDNGAAIASHRRAVTLAPDNPGVHTNLAYALLLDGQFEEGWAEYEWRIRLHQDAGLRRRSGAPPWQGEALDGGTLLIEAEQGFGDTIQFSRYTSMAAARSGGPVCLEVQPALKSLLACLDGVTVIARGEPRPAHARAVCLLSLPRLFGTVSDRVPAPVSYLRPPAERAAAWRARVDALPGLRVGLVWSGAPRLGLTTLDAADRRRSIPLEKLAPLGAVPQVSLVSLQDGPAGAIRPPAGLMLHDWTAELTDFAETAALVSALDLVISVDTAVAHLAGALGRPVWLLNRFDADWRWLRGREDSPWYPTLRQFRQKEPGAWPSVIASVAEALARMAAGPPENEPVEHGNECFQRKDYRAAAAAYHQAIALQPGHAVARGNLCLALLAQLRPNEAQEQARSAVLAEPGSHAPRLRLGLALHAAGRFSEAVDCLREACALQPNDADAQLELGNALSASGALDEAIIAHRRAVELRPDDDRLHANLGYVLLRAGQWAEGWREHDYRPTQPRLPPPERQWHGERLESGVLLLRCEQGYGDIIQFCRFAPIAATRAGVPVWLTAPLPLCDLLSALPEVTIVPPDIAEPEGREFPLLSLPRLLGTDEANIPASVPYLRADPVRAAAWRERLATLPGLRVGLAWAGNPDLGRASLYATDQRRSLPEGALAPLAAVPGISFVSLQVGRAPSSGLEAADWTTDLTDFAATAGLIEGLDLVISVDTAVAHLAGALGRPVWLLNRFDSDWRWLHGREDSPWYPTLRQFRQPEPCAWAAVIASVAEALSRMAAGPPANEPFEHGNARFRQKDYCGAAAAYRQAIALQPGHAGASGNLSVALLGQLRPDEAEKQARSALLASPGSHFLRVRLGIALHALGRFSEAVDCLREACATQPDDVDAQSALGNALSATGALDEGIAAHRRALELRPGTDLVHANLGYVLLQAGQWAEGWQEHEYRADRPSLPSAEQRWHGERLDGGVLLLRCEQGYGDIIQFCRYAPIAAARAGVPTWLTAPRPLRDLLGTLPGITIVPPEVSRPPGREFALLSLPLLFGTEEATIPARLPYLRADPVRAAAWRERLGALAGLRVGVAWAGNPGLGRASLYATDQRRSLPEGALAPLAAVPGVSFVSLQVGRAPASGLPARDWTAELTDFAATAALIEGLDLVISVDTAVAHLAGALGRPVWLLNRFDSDWRWLRDRTDSPWYPTLRQFRQPRAGDWESVVADVAAALTERAAVDQSQSAGVTQTAVTPTRSDANLALADDPGGKTMALKNWDDATVAERLEILRADIALISGVHNQLSRDHEKTLRRVISLEEELKALRLND
jgi:tetratricopeptide (TPR) repeat protein/enamine deaminase RidA (YjgF/YER057c/UK114 family)